MLRLAWRNVWRNGRRSLINVAAMGFGLAAIMFGQSMIKSLQAQLIEKATGTITGHIQIQNRNIKYYKIPDKMIEDIRKRREALAVIEAEQKARDERLELEAAKRRGVL